MNSPFVSTSVALRKAQRGTTGGRLPRAKPQGSKTGLVPGPSHCFLDSTLHVGHGEKAAVGGCRVLVVSPVAFFYPSLRVFGTMKRQRGGPQAGRTCVCVCA